MELVKMKYLDENTRKIKRKICGINQVYHGGEFTICGMATSDSNITINEFEKEGEYYEGKIKDITCDSCIGIIKYFKNMI